MSLVLLTLLLVPQAEPEKAEWTIDGSKRTALIYRPTKAPAVDSADAAKGAPVVFGFHGHGGNPRQAARSFHLHEEWPEAVVVYIQGVPTPGRLTDPDGKLPGWQHDPGDHEDRDLKFFDAVLATLKKEYQVDELRIYATGHSNGGGFTYLLWATRGDVFAALAPSAAVGARQLKDLKPKPVLHVAGENDELVKFQWQKLMLERVRKLNGCDEGKEWEKSCTWYTSKTGTPVVAYIHAGTHKFPTEAPPIIVKFFKEHAKP